MAGLLRASPMPNQNSQAYSARTVLLSTCPPRVLPVRAHASGDSLSLEYHATLGVSFGASKIEIKRAYRRLARRFHPDVCKDACSDQWFKRINHAYESLLNRSCWASAAVSATIFGSEAGNQSLEDLLSNEVGDNECWWSGEEESSSGACMDCSWLRVEESEEWADASIFSGALEEMICFSCEVEVSDCNVETSSRAS